MRIFLPENIWKNKRGFPFGKPVNYLKVGYHTGQDFFTDPVNTVYVMAPCDGSLVAYPFSKSAGWWGYFKFAHEKEVYSLKILHMYKEMRSGDYKEGDILGYCGATGLSITAGVSNYIGPSHEEQVSNNAVPHLHIELHKGEYKHDTNSAKLLADQRIIDPISNFEKWINKLSLKNNMIFYKEKGQSAVYIKGFDGVYYPIITGGHFVKLFGDWKENNILEFDVLNPKSENYFGLFNADEFGKYDMA